MANAGERARSRARRVDRAVTGLVVTAVDGAADVLAAATIWARATACRDGDPEPAPGEAAVPGLLKRLDVVGARLVLARVDGRPVGFTLVAPRADALEVWYVGVDPDAWGGGVARRLLRTAEDHARETGHEELRLWVIADNARAIRVYESAGWVGTDEVAHNPRSGRLERRFVRRVRTG
ncbi:GNAT family N-acetyltransferase [Actinosynnema sp. NPDC020468]|uniref:GNAT family N-acetyltransferase n=1 Tax=Actinosynnema sp. NPDC020468 TaxID=3154488 RepID=UPI0033C802E1